MNLHPDRNSSLTRVADRIDELITVFTGATFRFVDPQYSSTADMFAGKGSLFANGRWLLKGTRLATYTATAPETALGESLAANRYFGFPDQKSAPIVLVTASARLQRVIDLRDGKVRQRLRIAARTIVGCDWRKENGAGRESITQAWGWALSEASAEGILVSSAAWPSGTNLIVFPENLGNGSHLKVAKEVKWPRP